MIKYLVALSFFIAGSLHAMEKPTGRPIFAPALIITPEQEAEIAKLPEQERNYKLRDFIVHNVLEESKTFDEAIKRINNLVQEAKYKDILAFDIDYIKKYGPFEWLAQQQHAELDAIMKLYVYALTHDVKNQNFVTALRKALPGLDKLEKSIEKLYSDPLPQLIPKLAADSDTNPYINSYPLFENILNRFKGTHNKYFQIKIATTAKTLAAAEFIKKNITWEDLPNNILKYADYYIVQIVFLVQNLPVIASNIDQNRASIIMLFAINYHDKELVEVLLQKGFNPNFLLYVNDYYETALMNAVNKMDPEIIALLLEAGADPNEKSAFVSRNHVTYPTDLPLILAIQIGRADIVELLLNIILPQQIQALRAQERDSSYLGLLPVELVIHAAAKVKPWKADPNLIDSYGNRALNDAVKKGNLEIIKMLLDAGADINGKGGVGRTALMFAYGLHPDNPHKHDIIKFLIEKGADTAIRDDRGEKAQDYAYHAIPE